MLQSQDQDFLKAGENKCADETCSNNPEWQEARHRGERTMPTPVNAAANRRLRKEILAKRESHRLPNEHAAHLQSWEPAAIDETRWKEIRPLVHDAIQHSTLKSLGAFKKLCRNVTDFVDWANSHGHGATIGVLFLPTVIDDYVRLGMQRFTSGSRATNESALRGLARNVNPDSNAARQTTPVGYTPVKPPYDEIEAATIARIAETHPPGRTGRRFAACVGLGLGAGADPKDLRVLRRRSINLDASTPTVTLSGLQERTVEIRADYLDLVKIGIEGLGPSGLVVATNTEAKDVVASVMSRVKVLGACPELSQGRLRATWQAWLVEQPMRLADTMELCGLRSCRTLVDLVHHLVSEAS